MKRIVCFLVSLSVMLGCSVTPALASDNILNININDVSHPVSDTLYGISLEDTNYGCDGGMVANLVNNGSFEMEEKAESAWSFDNITAVLSTTDCMNKANPSYEALTIDGTGRITNNGFCELYKYKSYKYSESLANTPDMGFQKDEFYDFSCYMKNVDFDGTVSVYLNSKSNKNNSILLATDDINSHDWSRVSASLKSAATEDGGLTIEFDGKGTICIDFVSLVPQHSYGYGDSQWKYTALRQDMVDALKNISPSYIRFPGGCLVEGTDLENLYSWKNTIGPLEERKQAANIWSNPDNGNYYNNTSTMGYHEYFQLCEDLGAMPVPVVGAGITCQSKNEYDDYVEALKKTTMSDDSWNEHLINDLGYNKKDTGGITEYTEHIDSLGIKSDQDFQDYLDSIAFRPGTRGFDNYVQDILDLIEYANGDGTTTYWGSQRAANGHDAPFGIRYIAIGSECWGDVYTRNLSAIKKAINKKYPKIVVIASTGKAISSDTDEPVSSAVTNLDGTMADYHFCVDDNYFFQYDSVFDSYDRNGKGAIVGSYAVQSTKNGKLISANSVGAAVQEAGFLTALERNSDIVHMAAYSPSFAKLNANNSDTSMIWFDSMELALTPSYYVQMLFANNVGTEYISTQPLDSQKIYQSVTINKNSQELFVKLVNCNSSSKKVSINLDGFEDITDASNMSISHKYRAVANEIGKQYVAPECESVKFESNSCEVSLGAYSANVIRIAYGDNTGTSFYSVPDDFDIKTRAYFSPGAKAILVLFTIVFFTTGVSTYLVYTRVIIPKKKKDDK